MGDIPKQATRGSTDGCGVEQGTNHQLRSFIDGEERRPYAQTLANIANGDVFSMEDRTSAIFNRDMGELMARDRAFGKGATPDTPWKSWP
jgi:hypothetical protein